MGIIESRVIEAKVRKQTGITKLVKTSRNKEYAILLCYCLMTEGQTLFLKNLKYIFISSHNPKIILFVFAPLPR